MQTVEVGCHRDGDAHLGHLAAVGQLAVGHAVVPGDEERAGEAVAGPEGSPAGLYVMAFPPYAKVWAARRRPAGGRRRGTGSPPGWTSGVADWDISDRRGQAPGRWLSDGSWPGGCRAEQR